MNLPTLLCDSREPIEHARANTPEGRCDICGAPRWQRCETPFRPFVLAPASSGTPLADIRRVLLPMQRATLETGDYALPGVENDVAIERKSIGDLLGTLFGWVKDSNGEKVQNQDRFREELRRARDFEFFAIVIGGDPSTLWAEARARWERRAARDGGPTFNPQRVMEILWSFQVDLGIPHVWAGSHTGAERYVGTTLARIAEQSADGKAASKARSRGSVRAWLPKAET